MAKNRKIIILGILAIILAAGFLIYKSTGNSIKLPENNFDAIYQIPGTNIFFKYPSAGFYGLGIDITESSGIHTEPIAEFERNAQSAYVILDIDLIENEKNFANIDSFAEDFKKYSEIGFYDHEYARENGRFIDIDDQKYFIYKVTEDATAWSAYVIDKDGIVHVRLAYTGGQTPYSEAVYENNDKLFLEILKNIHFAEIPAFSNNEPETVIDSLWQSLNDSFLDVSFSEPAASSQWWISDDGWSISVPNAVSVTSSNPQAKELNGLISKIFLDNGFALNAANTSKSEAENEFYDYIVAFQKGETRCTLKTDGDNGEYTVACSNHLQEAHEEQIPYLKALDRRDVIVNVRERIGDFVWLDVHLRRTGNLALVKDEGGEMRLIFSGQEAPPCDLMIENEVPKEVYGTCNGDAGNIVE